MKSSSNERGILDMLSQNIRENDIEQLEVNMEKFKNQIQEHSINQLLFLSALHLEHNEQSQTLINFLINMYSPANSQQARRRQLPRRAATHSSDDLHFPEQLRNGQTAPGQGRRRQPAGHPRQHCAPLSRLLGQSQLQDPEALHAAQLRLQSAEPPECSCDLGKLVVFVRVEKGPRQLAAGLPKQTPPGPEDHLRHQRLRSYEIQKTGQIHQILPTRVQNELREGCLTRSTSPNPSASPTSAASAKSATCACSTTTARALSTRRSPSAAFRESSTRS